MEKILKAELAFAFSQMYDEELKKVPENLLKEVSTDFDVEKFLSFDKSKPFTAQTLSREALEIIASIFEN